MRLNRSNILKMGFQEIGGRAYRCAYWRYDPVLMGEVPIEVVVKKKKRKYWIGNQEVKATDCITRMYPEVQLHGDLGFVYLLGSDLGHKIGMSKNLHQRMAVFGVKLPFEWELLAYCVLLDYRGLERALHEKFSEKKINGEWYDLSEADLALIGRILRKASHVFFP